MNPDVLSPKALFESISKQKVSLEPRNTANRSSQSWQKGKNVKEGLSYRIVSQKYCSNFF